MPLQDFDTSDFDRGFEETGRRIEAGRREVEQRSAEFDRLWQDSRPGFHDRPLEIAGQGQGAPGEIIHERIYRETIDRTIIRPGQQAAQRPSTVAAKGTEATNRQPEPDIIDAEIIEESDPQLDDQARQSLPPARHRQLPPGPPDTKL